MLAGRGDEPDPPFGVGGTIAQTRSDFAAAS